MPRRPAATCQVRKCYQPMTHVWRRGRYCPSHAPPGARRLPPAAAGDPDYAAIAEALSAFCARHRGSAAHVALLGDGRLLARVRCPSRATARVDYEERAWRALEGVPLSALGRLADLLVIHPADRDAGYELALFNIDLFAGELGELSAVIAAMSKACRLGAAAPTKVDIARWRDRLRAVASRLPERLRQRRGHPRSLLPLRRDLP